MARIDRASGLLADASCSDKTMNIAFLDGTAPTGSCTQMNENPQNFLQKLFGLGGHTESPSTPAASTPPEASSPSSPAISNPTGKIPVDAQKPPQQEQEKKKNIFQKIFGGGNNEKKKDTQPPQ